MSLPLHWVDAIFKTLGLIYGQDFLNRWKGMALSEVKSAWAERLAGFEAHPSAISWALERVSPDRPPTVLQFAELCRRAPTSDRLALSKPEANPDRVRAEFARLKSTLYKDKVQGSADWAHRILDQHQAGAVKTVTVLAMARAVADRHPRPGSDKSPAR